MSFPSVSDPGEPVGAHRFGLHGAERHLVGLVQVVSAVHLVLKARLFPDRVVRAVLRRDHPGDRDGAVREDKRLEYGPAGVGWDGGGGLQGEKQEVEKHRLRNSHQPKEKMESRRKDVGQNQPRSEENCSSSTRHYVF